METVLLALIVYLLIGTIALGLLDLITKRIRTRLREASYDSQANLERAGAVVGSRTALVLTVGALWLFWPAAIIGAIIGLVGNDENKEQQ